MNKTTFKIMVALAIVVALLQGCATQQGNYAAGTYSNGLQEQQVQLGQVISVQPVRGLGGKTAGEIGGAIVGGLLGSTVGNRSGRTLATAVGAIAGGFGGGYAESQLTAKQALQVTVRLQTGQVIGVVETDYRLAVGQRVQVIHNRGAGYNASTTRVLPL